MKYSLVAWERKNQNTTRTEPKYTDTRKSRIIQTKGVKRDVLGVKR